MADDEPPTPIRTSGTYPILRKMAEEEIDRLKRLGTNGDWIVARLRAQIAILSAWSPSNPPTDQERKDLIDELWATLKAADKFR